VVGLASTVALAMAPENQGLTDSGNGCIPFGWLVVEDLAKAVVMVLVAPMAVLMAHYGGGLG
jgi:predicted Kef-type K+ transport protein